jgi:hypothetical protein
VPDVLPLHTGQVDVLSEVILGHTDTEWLQLCLSLEVFFGDLALDNEGSDFDDFLNFLLDFVLDFLNVLLDLNWLGRLFLEVVNPCGEDLR